MPLDMITASLIMWLCPGTIQDAVMIEANCIFHVLDSEAKNERVKDGQKNPFVRCKYNRDSIKAMVYSPSRFEAKRGCNSRQGSAARGRFSYLLSVARVVVRVVRKDLKAQDAMRNLQATIMPRTCLPPYYPDPGICCFQHSASSKTKFYVVTSGHVKSIFTSHYRSNAMTNSGARQKSVATWGEAVDIWTAHCLISHQHGGGCSLPNPLTMLWGAKGFHRTFASRAQMSKKCVRSRVPKEQRKNLRLWAEGARQEVLEPHIEPYSEALVRGWRDEHNYLNRVSREYHARISWRLKDHEETESLLPFDTEALIPEETLTAEEEVKKGARIKKLDERIRRWLKYCARVLRKKARARADARKDPVTALEDELQIFIVGDDVVRPWRVGSCYNGV
ncbi:hypothetical protein DFH06DRAFT_1122954 [Mycena polygramma]|nr:hypothetical protein DFH06DRAFT_1122954 [Mycena polygramma]